MKIKPILFSAPMVQAILDGRKTQTRRIIKSKHESGLFQVCSRKSDGQITEITSLDWDERPRNDCSNDIQPLAKVGDILWVRETYTILEPEHCEGMKVRFYYKASHHLTNEEWRLECIEDGYTYKWKPSIFMPKAACRIFLEVTNVRVERLQDISEKDAKDEGIEFSKLRTFPDYRNYLIRDSAPLHIKFQYLNPIKSFQSLWQSINGKESWKANPWVWVYSFKQVSKPENFIR